MRGLIVCIWGQSGTGKTALSAALAARLAQEINVLLASGDKVNPAYVQWMPDDKGKKIESIASILDNSRIDRDYLCTISVDQPYRIVPFPDNERIGLIGYLKDDDIERYNPIEGTAAERFLNVARSFVDVSIIDGVANPADDALTSTAIKTADIVITMIEPSAKGVGYLCTMQNWITRSNIAPRHLLLASPVDESSAIETVENTAGIQLFGILPYSDEVRKKNNECRLFTQYKKAYAEHLNRIAELIEEEFAVREVEENGEG
jgi:MinD superfamily P-loop ATPase